MDTNQIIQGDCVEVMQTFEENSIDMVLTSPPYDDLREYDEESSFEFESIAQELKRVLKEGGVVVWVTDDQTVNGSETGKSFREALYFKEIGFNIHDTMIYKKDSIAFPNETRYYNCFEYMFVLSLGKPKTVNLLRDRDNKTSGDSITGSTDRCIDGSLRPSSGNSKNRSIKDKGVRWNIWEYGIGWNKSYSEKFVKEHPAVFPEQLAWDHIKSWSDKGDIVLDPMCGSGTTCKMAKMSGRNYIGIDISKKYVDIAKKRVSSVSERWDSFVKTNNSPTISDYKS